MYQKKIYLFEKSLDWGHRTLSLAEILNQLNDSSQAFSLIYEKLSLKEREQLTVFTRNIDALFLDNFISGIQERLKTESRELSENIVDLLNQTKNLYLINTIIALKYLETLQQLKNNQEQLTLAYMSNKIGPSRIMLNKIIEKDIHHIKEFDGIFISEKTGTLIEVKHTLTKYAFKQIFGYTIKKKNKNKHSHLDVLLDKQLCQENQIPKIENLAVVFSSFSGTCLADQDSLSNKIKELTNNSITSFTKSEFITYLHEFFGQKETQLKIQEDLELSDIKNIFFYRLANPDYRLIFQENSHILCHPLIDNLENFIKFKK